MDETMGTVAGEGTRYRTVSCGLTLHRLPDSIVTVGLGGQLERHVGHHWFAVVMFADGRGIALGATNHTPAPPEEAIAWMAKAAVALNRDLHEDGHWIVAWDPGQRIPVLLWRDADGDLHCAVEIAADAARGHPLEAYDRARLMEIAGEALAAVREQAMKAAVASRQQVKLAQGGEALAHRLAAGRA